METREMPTASRVRRFAAIFGLALAARLGYLALHPPAAVLQGDAQAYDVYAASLLKSGHFVGPNGDQAGRMPGYPLFLAAVYAVFGRSPGAVALLQCVLGSLTCALIAAACAGLLEDPWPWAAGTAAALYFGLYSSCAALLSECAYNFAASAAFASMLAPWRPARAAALCGLALGIAYLIRPEILPTAIAVAALFPWLAGGRFSRSDAFLAGAAFLLPITPWIVRNALAFHRFLPAASTGAFNAYAALRIPLTPPGVSWTSFFQPPPGVDEFARDHYFVLAHRALWHQSSWGQIARAYAYDGLVQLYPFLPGYDWSFVLLAPYWLAGLWAARGQKPLWPFALFVIFSAGVYTLFGGPVSRYRCEYAPGLLILAAAGAAWCWRRWPRRAPRWAAAWALANGAAAAFAGPGRHFLLGAKRLLFP